MTLNENKKERCTPILKMKILFRREECLDEPQFSTGARLLRLAS